MLDVLDRANLPRPVQQFRVLVGGEPRLLDFASPDALVAIEWDGFAEHGLIRSTFDDDRDRDAELQLLGWIVIHVTSNTRRQDLERRGRQALALRGALLAA